MFSTDAPALLRKLAMLATVVIAFWGEYQLAAAAGFPWYVAVFYPLGLDCFLWLMLINDDRRGIAWGLGLALASQEIAHLIHANWSSPVNVGVTAFVSAAMPLVAWRMHQHTEPTAAAPAEPVEQPVDAADPDAAALLALAAALPPKGQRRRDQTVATVARIRAALPHMPEVTIADALGISPAYVRRVAPRAA
ncbi:hypothetical protein AB0M43_33715 [Longispora sp. NPDC051575]|uniref:hypothetical protein n=1 Tax=Longispora sp. NPDC051575 TaxID=3154943 RepID=UPI00341DE78D